MKNKKKKVSKHHTTTQPPHQPPPHQRTQFSSNHPMHHQSVAVPPQRHQLVHVNAQLNQRRGQLQQWFVLVQHDQQRSLQRCSTTTNNNTQPRSERAIHPHPWHPQSTHGSPLYDNRRSPRSTASWCSSGSNKQE